MSSPTPARVDLPQLTGPRAIAALSVVIFHFSNDPFAKRLDYGLGQNLILVSGRTVDLFFILSGFVLSLAYFRRFHAFSIGPYGSFLWRRLARLYPLHLVTMIVWIIWFAAERPDMPLLDLKQLQPRFFLENLFFINGWNAGGDHSINFVAWAASIEFLAYVAYPALVLIALRVGLDRHPVVALALMLVASIFTWENNIWRLATEFTAGVCLFHIYFGDSALGVSEKAWFRRFVVFARHEAVVGAMLLLGLTLGLVAAPWLPPLFALFVARLIQVEDGWSRAFSYGPLVKLGGYSYALYMVHPFVGYGVERLELAGWLNYSSYGLWALSLTLAQGLAILVFYGVEEPARRALLGGK